MTTKPLTLGHSPDPDDAFMFYALAGQPKIDTEGLAFEHVLSDIQTCNERAERGELDITALSLHGYTYVADKYRMTTCGASVGDGYGPLLVSKTARTKDQLRDVPIAVPGVRTTAYLALKLYFPQARTKSLPFDAILDAVAAGTEDVGLLIHEGQLTWGDYGVHKVEDLGAWWKRETSLPLPLGINAVRRDLPDDLQRKIQRVLQRSIEYGLEHRQAALAYAKGFGRGIDDARNDRFVGMYVNDFTLDLGDRGRKGVTTLLQRAAAAGLVRSDVPLDFVT